MCALLPSLQALAQSIELDPPGEREFILDHAQLIEAQDETAIKAMCDALLSDTAIPIIVVTIESMAEHTRFDDMRIETFAHLLFDQWGIGHAEIDGATYNTGMLLVVSKNDRKARIQLGDGWGRGADDATARIMNDVIVPRFKRSDFSGGIRAGVEELEKLARFTLTTPRYSGDGNAAQQPNAGTENDGTGQPAQRQPPFDIPRDALPPIESESFLNLPEVCPIGGCGGGGIILVIIIARILGSLLYRGGSGSGTGHAFPWMWGNMMGGSRSSSSGGSIFSGGSRSRSSGGGGFSGGSFGGGFSGGRGASGSW
ncbi:MAG: TPM domain-containing protein [Phycisphaerales bacterium]